MEGRPGENLKTLLALGQGAISPFCLRKVLCRPKGIPFPPNASALQKWPLSGHLALFRGAKRKPRKHHFDQCLRGNAGMVAAGRRV